LLSSNRTIDILNLNPAETQQEIGLTAQATLQENGVIASWDARFARLSDTLDPKTRTVGVIVEVDKPYANVIPGKRPPLVKGLFVQVVIAGKPQPDSLVIPRAALHKNRLYVVNKEQRLEIRTVQPIMQQAEYVTINKALKPGEQVIVSDLIPAVEGMLLKPVPDPASQDRLVNAATGGPAL
ncbi:MAG: hypothetical protein P1R74_11300, partial [Sedimenticola sp.]|nr:hypothetical protein [Sedimenticola sp.]